MVESKEIKEYSKKAFEFIQDKKVQTIITIVLLIATIFLGAFIRVQGLPNLKDPTTGDYTPLALDPYYFLRVSETLIANNGNLPVVDSMRYPALGAGWANEMTPYSTNFLYKIMGVFNPDISLRLVNVLNPVIFFILGIIIFALLVFLLTKNKWITVISTGILSIIPPYLYRTLAGFSDHESIGMFGIFLALIFFAIGMFYLEKKKNSGIYSGVFGLISGFMTMFAIAAWGGGAKFLFMILPLAFIVLWLTKKDKNYSNYFLFYFLWFISTILFAPLFNYDVSYILTSFMLSSAGILTIFTMGFIIMEIILIKTKILNKNLEKYRGLFSLGGVIVFGAILYQIFIGNFFSFFASIINKILYPFGTGRVGLTVAENKQPYLTELIAQVGKFVFYTFLAGCFIVGGKLASGIKKKKFRKYFTVTFAFFIFGILFSRVSASSALNGDNFLSKALFFISFLAFAITSFYIYWKSDWEIKTTWIFIAAWMIPMLLSVRSAIRVFFAIVPFISMMVPITLFEIGKFAKKSKDEMAKLLAIVILLVLVVGIVWAAVGFTKTITYQAKNQAPSYNTDWQNAMSWVRNNTVENGIFLHWWDYGYWVQTGGERPTVTDGGHANGHWDHLVGRYVLTTPYPETAKSFMKSHNVSYLLIDPTDIGKYSAYSSIGDDNENSDRASWLVTLVSDPKETQETRNETTRIYRGGTYLDVDLSYKLNGKTIFLPKGKAAIDGITLKKTNTGYYQPEGIYLYNGQQYNLPIRYMYFNGNLQDFGKGINSTVYLYTNVYSSPTGTQFDVDGAVMYLSEKTKDSLVAKLYLMGDPLDEYSELELLHEESQYPLKFYYGGFRGPISIWGVNEMPDILVREEFTALDGGYGELDDLVFIK